MQKSVSGNSGKLLFLSLAATTQKKPQLHPAADVSACIL